MPAKTGGGGLDPAGGGLAACQTNGNLAGALMMSETHSPPHPSLLRLIVPTVVAALILGWLLLRGGETPVVVGIEGPTMGTSYMVRLVDPPAGLDEEGLAREVDTILERIDARMSTYDPDSELSRINRAAGKKWIEVSAETAHVVAEGLRIAEMTAGAFDVTVGPLVNLWGFGPQGRPERIPPDEAIEAALARTGPAMVEVRRDPPAVRKAHDEVFVDLGGIAKGYGVDAVAERLDALGAANYLIDVGGEIRARGVNPRGRPWQIGIETPVPGQAGVERVVAPGTMALATSGDYRNFFEEDGVRFSHLIDPRTGWPVAHRLASATVLAPTCAEADALATALMVLGPEDSLALAEQHDWAVLLLVAVGDEFEVKTTPQFEPFLR